MDQHVPGNTGGHDDQDESVSEKLSEMGVGTTDPNIIGDAGPLDVPPGADPETVEAEPEPDEG